MFARLTLALLLYTYIQMGLFVVHLVHRPLAQHFCHFLLSNNERLIISFDEMHFITSGISVKTVA